MTWLADPVLCFIVACFPLAVFMLKHLGATWRQAIAGVAVVYAAATAAGAALSIIFH